MGVVIVVMLFVKSEKKGKNDENNEEAFRAGRAALRTSKKLSEHIIAHITTRPAASSIT